MSTPHSTRPDQTGQVPGQARYGEPVRAGYPEGGATEETQFARDLARSAWPAFLAAGLASLALGIMLLAWPSATLTIGAVLIGASLIVAGLLRLIHGFTAHDQTGGRRAAGVVIGLLAIIVGLYCIRHYHITIAVVAILVGLFWVMHGISEIALGLFGGPQRGRLLTLLTGVLSVAAGLIVLFWPTISITILVAVIGIWLIVYGLIMTFAAFGLRRTGAAGVQERSARQRRAAHAGAQ